MSHSGIGRSRRRVDGPAWTPDLELARSVAARFLELHPEVHAEVDELASDAIAYVLDWNRRHRRTASERHALALMRSRLYAEARRVRGR